MIRFWWFIIEWLLLVYCLLMEIIDWLYERGFITCSFMLFFIGYCMSIFKKVVAWPWKKILTVVVKVASWILDKLPADQKKLPSP